MTGLLKIDVCHGSTLGGGGGIGNAVLVLVTCDIGGDTTATYGSCMATSVGAPDGEPGGNVTNGGLVEGGHGMRTFDGCPGGGDIAGGYADLGLTSG